MKQEKNGFTLGVNVKFFVQISARIFSLVRILVSDNFYHLAKTLLLSTCKIFTDKVAIIHTHTLRLLLQQKIYFIILYYIHYTILYYTILILYYTILYYTILYILYTTILYNFLLFYTMKKKAPWKYTIKEKG